MINKDKENNHAWQNKTYHDELTGETSAFAMCLETLTLSMEFGTRTHSDIIYYFW